MSGVALRVVDDDLGEAQAHMAAGAALIEAVRTGAAPPTLRFFRLLPSLLLGLHQPMPGRVPPGVTVARRPTGGGTIYVDERQLCWEVALPLAALGVGTLAEAAERLGGAAAMGLSVLGPAVRFAPPNALTVDGRKLCGLAGLIDSGVLLCQASLLVDGEPERIARLSGAPPAAARTLTTLAIACGTAPEMEAVKTAVIEGFGVLGKMEWTHAV